MHALSASDKPTVSIILPTYNRAEFLPEAFESVKSQTYTNWELHVVDDGSTDHTRTLVEQCAADLKQPVHYLWQQNQGAYGARNTGLDFARGLYIAFYDSDDLWLPHHLQHCVEALDAHPDVSWVFGATQIVDYATGQVLVPTTFHLDGQLWPFMRLRTRASGDLRIVEDCRVLRYMILYEFYSGLQVSMLRRELFEGRRFEAGNHNSSSAEDQLFCLRSLLCGKKIAYYDNIHMIYRIHESHASAAGSASNLERRELSLRLMIEGYERILHECNWKMAERRALYRRLQRDSFWQLGYATLWESGRRFEALQKFRKGLYYWPWDWRCWKTYASALLRYYISSKLYHA